MLPKFIISVLLISFCFILHAQPVLTLTTVPTSGLSQPLQLVNAADGSNKIYIVEKGGNIKVFDASFNYIGIFLTVTGINAGGEQGLLSLAFHPQYETNGMFYVYYNTAAGDLEIARYTVNLATPNVVDPATKVVVIHIPHPTHTNHNGGELHFGSDAYLYLTTGDGGSGGDPSNNAQNTSSLLGKMLRFNVNTSLTAPFYTIPPGNPYDNLIYATGLRNPFRWSFDRLTQDIWIGDVGQDVQEEINYRAGGTGAVNYGWRCYEGDNPYNTSGCAAASNYVFPVHAYATQNPSAAVTGGVVYRGAVYPAIQGYYIAADYYSGTLYKIAPNGSGGWNKSTQTSTITAIADFGETENGELYAVTLFPAAIYRVSSGAPAPVPVTLTAFTGINQNNGVKLTWNTQTEINTRSFEIEYSKNGTYFQYLDFVPARNISSGASYTYNHKVQYNGALYYRLRIVDTDGSAVYSGIIRLQLDNSKSLIAPTLISNSKLQFNLPAGVYSNVEVISSNGSVVAKYEVKGQSGFISIPLNVSKGTYMVRFSGVGESVVERIVVL